MGVYVNGNYWWISYTPAKGAKRDRESTNVPVSAEGGKAEAEAILARIKLQARQQQWFPEELEDCTVKELETLWFQREKAKQKRSLSADRVRFTALKQRLGEGVKLSSLRPSHVMKLRESLEGEGYAPATVNRFFALLRASLRWAKIQQRRVPESLLMAIQTPVEHNQRERTCSREEYERFISFLEQPKGKRAFRKDLRLAIIMGYWTGMRLGEICSLEWKEIDLEQGFIELKREKTKTNTSRVVPLHPVVIEELKKAPRRGEKVFTSKRDAISSGFTHYANQLGMEGLVFHSLRHTALSNLSEQGVDLSVLKAISGHKTTAVLMRYVHPSRASLRSAISKLRH